jgi:RNA polymerase sigma-70 factor (ECF subfamily)
MRATVSLLVRQALPEQKAGVPTDRSRSMRAGCSQAPRHSWYASSSARRGETLSMVDAAQAENDELLVRAAAQGDREALGALYDRFSPLLLSVAHRMLGSTREAEDLVHDVFLEAWHRARHYDRARGSVRTWLMLRLRSRALDRLRATKRAGAVLFDEALQPRGGSVSETHTAAPDAALDHKALVHALATLPKDQRAVLELGYFAGQSCAEIAGALSVPVGTVKSRMSRAIAHLRTQLQEREEDAS